jgi:hypothetical protein
LAEREVRKVEDPKIANALVQAFRLKVDAYKWTASKLIPKAYGERMEQHVTGAVGVQLITSVPRPERTIEADPPPELPSRAE